MCTSENCMLVRNNPICSAFPYLLPFERVRNNMNILISKKCVANGSKEYV